MLILFTSNSEKVSAFRNSQVAGRNIQKNILTRQLLHERHDNEIESSENNKIIDRRKMFLNVASITSLTMLAKSASAYEKAYPVELSAPGDDVLDRRSRKVNEIKNQEAQRMSDAGTIAETPILSTFVWSSALWFLSGSRSNPIATPLANIIYKKEQEEWLQDRNDGLFANLPWEFLIILGIVYVSLGFVTDTLATTLAEGDRTISLQLAGVSLITGCSLELGRIFSGEKKQTREDYDRDNTLRNEFIEFANNRLKSGGNCHRNEVVRAFRRYYAKYRQSDNEEYPLNDLEIEQLLRTYCLSRGVEMSSAGFYSGIQINEDADVFVQR